MEDHINRQQQKQLLKIARQTIEKKTKDIWLEIEEINQLPDIYKEKRGCFVTLTKNSNLRGCIGYILPIAPLYQAVIENAYNAAFSDPRFPPVTSEELEQLHLEISVLTVPRALGYQDSQDLLDQLKPEIDGVIIQKGSNSATFLPQVWQQLPEKEEFLAHLCLKAGLFAQEWKKGDITIETYQALVFEEE